MKKRAAGLLLLTVLVPVSAFAENIEGRVVQVSPGALDVRVYDPQGRPYPNTLNLKADYRTAVAGVDRLSDFQTDDPVSVDVTQEESGGWRAEQVTLLSEVQGPATQNPPPTMRDVLGNPVVKGALLGAATGAIASSASGGKAGKGALVGAGVGAAAGLLGPLFGGGDE